MKNYKVKLHIDKSVSPITRKHSRAPFHLREKVGEEIVKLEKAGIIEKVEGPKPYMIFRNTQRYNRKI